MVWIGEHRKPSQIMNAQPEGRRIRGRQRKIYMEIYIEEISRKFGIVMTELKKAANKRKDRRRSIRTVLML